MADKILLVDDEPSVLDGYKRLLYRDFIIETATSGACALTMVEVAGPFSVVISDMQMPGMNGAEFLAMMRQRAPNTVRILLTGHAALDMAIDAINRGKIFRFLNKPCPKEVLVEAINEGIEQYRAAESERELAEKSRMHLRADSEWMSEGKQAADGFEGLAGLQGTEHAMRFLQGLFDDASLATIVLFKLTFFRSVADRYGEEVAAEYLLSSVQFLKDGFPGVYRLFQWRGDVLLAVIERPIPQNQIRLELSRLMAKNEQHILEHNGRRVMLAYSITFDLLALAQFSSLEEISEAFDAKLFGRL